MSKRRGRRGNTQKRLQKALIEQRALEHELEQLSKAQSQEQGARAVKECVLKAGEDPMLAEDNPFPNTGPTGCSCTIL